MTRLRAARLAAGLTLQAVADQMGVTKGAVGHAETGRVNPSASFLVGYLRAVGKDAEADLIDNRTTIPA